MYKYFVEFWGVVVLTYASLLTDGNPFVMGVTYFSVYIIGQEVEKVYFNPLFVVANAIMGRMTFGEAWTYLLTQALALLSTLVTFVPTKTFIDAM